MLLGGKGSLWATSTMSVSLRLSEKALQSLLESLTCPPYTPTQHLEREQALAKEFAEILHFTLRFDELKVRPCGLGPLSRFVRSPPVYTGAPSGCEVRGREMRDLWLLP